MDRRDRLIDAARRFVADRRGRPADGELDLCAEGAATSVAGQRVLVTGAGGTIGRELCRQLMRGDPERLVMLDQHEASLFDVYTSLTRTLARRPTAGAALPRLRAVVADVGDAVRIAAVMRDEAPGIVFHAAAYKHVPLMEANPCAAIINNVRGTRLLIEAAVEAEVSQVVVISSDKAVNPISVMGATKRVTELMTRSLGAGSDTRCAAVRFGNVLGSSGSVLDVFLDQVTTGGPLTVTDPGAHRYFMFRPEAVRLLLQVTRLNDGRGAVYAIDPGPAIPVVDLARSLVRELTGGPETIPILYTGLRPGEKLCEEWLGAGETTQPTNVERILRIQPADDAPNPDALRATIGRLEREALADETASALGTLRELAGAPAV